MKFIETVIKTWKILSSSAPQDIIESSIKRSENGNKLTIEINTKQYIATIEAWEQAYSMDISVTELSSNNGVLLSAGECTSLDEIHERTTLLFEMLVKE